MPLNSSTVAGLMWNNTGTSTVEPNMANRCCRLRGIVCNSGVLFCLVSFVVKIAGTGWINIMFPPAAMGAIVAVIGLELAGVAANMAGLLPAEGHAPDSKVILVSMATLAVTVFGSVLFRGFCLLYTSDAADDLTTV